MNIKECYDKMGADFNEVMQRLGSENFIKRFAIKFLDDSSYQRKRMQNWLFAEHIR